uniref:Uncharacterized protein n=1 Tax=Opuntia streptacantha TaxID=393608 RepID=A0A7C9EW64_OPUST
MLSIRQRLRVVSSQATFDHLSSFPTCFPAPYQVPLHALDPLCKQHFLQLLGKRGGDSSKHALDHQHATVWTSHQVLPEFHKQNQVALGKNPSVPAHACFAGHNTLHG